MLAGVNGGQNRRVRHRPEATSAEEEALVPSEVAKIRECVDVLRNPSLSSSASSPSLPLALAAAKRRR